MNKYFQKNIRNEMGLSLVELLASIVILSLLLTFFLGMFIQSSKVNVKSEEVIDATYAAQTEIENLYAVSKQTEFKERKNEIVDTLSYVFDSGIAGDPFLVFTKDTTDYSIILKLENDIEIDPTNEDYNAMTSAIVEVEAKVTAAGDNSSAKMELLLQWKVDSTP